MYLSIIIPTYNSKGPLIKAIGSILKQCVSNIEIIVIDNGSSDETFSFVADNYPSLKIVRNDKNMGAAFARNQGVNLSVGDYVMFLDCDAEINIDFLLKLESIVEKVPQEIVAIAPKIINKNSGKIFSCGLNISSVYRVYDMGKNKSSYEFSQPIQVDGPNSCCAIFKRECLDKIKERNYFDEDFFFLFEDADLALRLKNKELKAFFYPELICYHQEGSSAFTKEFRRFLCFRNRWYMILKNKKGLGLAVFILKSSIYDFLRTIYFALTNSYFLEAVKDINRAFKSRK